MTFVSIVSLKRKQSNFEISDPKTSRIWVLFKSKKILHYDPPFGFAIFNFGIFTINSSSATSKTYIHQLAYDNKI